jgi:two-component system response regulator FixJ
MSPGEHGKQVGNTANARPVYLVDDDDELRRCLGSVLLNRGFVVAGFESGHRFLSALPSLPPGCVVADLRMNDGDGIELLQKLREHGGRFPVIMVSGFADVAVAVRAMKLGAFDFIEKPFSLQALVDAIEAAFGPGQAGADEESGAAATAEARQRLTTLTPRERDVLDGVVSGWTNRAIAQSLNISQRTVELHRAHLMEKLGARNASQLVRISLLASGQIAPAESAI